MIARHGGGALETVEDGVTGRFFTGGADELAGAILSFDDAAIDPVRCARNAARFDAASFRRGIHAEIGAAWAEGSRPALAERQPLASTRLLRRAARDHGRATR